MESRKQIRVLFVCMGNICRSPTAHGVFQDKVQAAGLSHVIKVDSAGTHAYHVGEPPDRRSQQTARQRGYDLSTLRARKVSGADFAEHDYFLVMDEANLADALANCPPQHTHKVQLLLDFAASDSREVPDPYYGGSSGFEHVLDLVEAAAEGLLQDIRTRHLSGPRA